MKGGMGAKTKLRRTRSKIAAMRKSKQPKPWPTDDHIDEDIGVHGARVAYTSEVTFNPEIHNAIRCRWVTKGNPRDAMVRTCCAWTSLYTQRVARKQNLVNAIKNHIAQVHLQNNRTSMYYHGGQANANGELSVTPRVGSSEVN